MEFITQLPLSNNFESILVVVDRFSKIAIFIPAYGTITSLDLAQISISHVFSKNFLPVIIIIDRGSSFVSSFWTNLCQQLKISRDLSASFHPETDGQTEMVDQILEQYLLMYFSYHKYDWHTWLPLAEFAYNNEENQPRNHLFPPFMEEIPALTQSIFLKTHLLEIYQQNTNEYSKELKNKLESEIRQFKNYADRNRTIPPYFQPVDRVWLASKNIKTTRPTKKLSERWLGPFEVLKKIGSHAYHLKLPLQWKSVHPVFHV
ncbi:hypothetical protein O181_082512 [Austropuccinia psidii MF-1]|uniref:Integrase catalytic domain-containing protein n=1 Tax=Austropuccinia psidii MF-1 TaxID=1389203 RepID=A0A9Q3FQK3_9BASI|nr:hypothetical protein [Austropuccinia psidii MF-1]